MLGFSSSTEKYSVLLKRPTWQLVPSAWREVFTFIRLNLHIYFVWNASSGRFVDKEVMKEELNINNQNESIQVENDMKTRKGFDTKL